MMKLGQVTITVEPHVFEATMFAVKDPKPPPPPQPTAPRPVLQYGPPNGVMPPPPTPKSAQSTEAATTPVPTASQPQTPAQPQVEVPPAVQTPTHSSAQAPTRAPSQPQASPQTQVAPQAPVPAAPRLPVASPRGMESVLAPNSVVPQPSPAAPAPAPAHHPAPVHTQPSATPMNLAPGNRGVLSAPLMAPMRTSGPLLQSAGSKTPTPAAPPPKPPGGKAPGADPIILTLAEKAGTDPELRDLMKKVAQGDAQKHELEKFQSIIDSITAESRRNVAAGPSADKLMVDRKSVKYYAVEVRAIVDIVLLSNPKITSARLNPPAGTNPLVIALVKAALDDPKLKEMIERIAVDRPHFQDATELKAKLDQLHSTLAKERQQSLSNSSAAATPKAGGVPNGQASAGTTQPPAAQQALRSKGPPPPPKPDISAIVFEFAGGTGDRYLFPKFSILETLQVPAPQQQVVASFLIVRRGSKSEYPTADPELDYYQPVTIRLFTNTGRHLENLARVVAPEEEVRRYMDDIMEKMTRAEYVLLAMRLPRGDREGESSPVEKDKAPALTNGGPASKQAAEQELAPQPLVLQAPQPPPPTVLWATRPPKPEIREVVRSRVYKPIDTMDEQYQSFISTVKKKEPKEV